MADHDAKIDDLIRDASSLAAVTGARVAVIAVKPDGEVRQYGCPSVDAVMRPFVGGGSGQHGARPLAARNQAVVDRLVRRFVEKKRSEDANYGAATASERELKDLQWELEVLERLRQRLERA